MFKQPKKQFRYEYCYKADNGGFQQKVCMAFDEEHKPFLRASHETWGAISKRDRRDWGNDWYQPHRPKKSWKFRCKKRHQWERHFHPVSEYEHSHFLEKQHLERVLLDMLSQAKEWTIVDTVSSWYAKWEISDAIRGLLDKHLLELGTQETIPEYALAEPYSMLLLSIESKLWEKLFRPYETLRGHKGDVEYKLPCGNAWLDKRWWWLWKICPIVRVIRPADFQSQETDNVNQNCFPPHEYLSLIRRRTRMVRMHFTGRRYN